MTIGHRKSCRVDTNNARSIFSNSGGFSYLLCAGGGDQASEDSKAQKDLCFQPRALTCWQIEAPWGRAPGWGLRGQIEYARNFRALSTLMRHISPLWSYQSIGSIRIKVKDGSFSLKQSKTKENSPTQTSRQVKKAWKPSPAWSRYRRSCLLADLCTGESRAWLAARSRPELESEIQAPHSPWSHHSLQKISLIYY